MVVHTHTRNHSQKDAVIVIRNPRVTKTKPTELHFDFLNTRKLNNIKTFKAMLNYRSLFAHVHPGTHPAFTYFYYLLSILAYLLHIL